MRNSELWSRYDLQKNNRYTRKGNFLKTLKYLIIIFAEKESGGKKLYFYLLLIGYFRSEATLHSAFRIPHSEFTS